MDTKSRLALAGGVAVGIGLLLADRLAERRKEVITLNQEMPAPASEVLDLIKQVEREWRLIPLISSVEVHRRTDTEVRYSVRAAGGLPAAVRYVKWWDESLPAAYWRSERGTAGFHHEGTIHFTEREGGSTAHLRSEHWMMAPFIGRPAAPMLTPIIQAGLEVWLKHIAEELEKRRD